MDAVRNRRKLRPGNGGKLTRDRAAWTHKTRLGGGSSPFRPAASRSRAAEREQFGPGDDDGTRPPLELPGMAPTQQADKTVRDHQHAVTSVLGPWATGTILPGFADPPADTAERAYPAATRDRLRQVKARYDPDGILLHSFPLS